MRCITHKIVLSPEKRGFYAKVVFNFYFLILIWIIFKVFVEFVQYCLMFWLFGCKACGMLNPQQGLNLYPLRWTVKPLPLDCQGSPTSVICKLPASETFLFKSADG